MCLWLDDVRERKNAADSRFLPNFLFWTDENWKRWKFMRVKIIFNMNIRSCSSVWMCEPSKLSFVLNGIWKMNAKMEHSHRNSWNFLAAMICYVWRARRIGIPSHPYRHSSKYCQSAVCICRIKLVIARFNPYILTIEEHSIRHFNRLLLSLLQNAIP